MNGEVEIGESRDVRAGVVTSASTREVLMDFWSMWAFTALGRQLGHSGAAPDKLFVAWLV